MLDHLEGLEENRHGVGRIGQPSMGESIGGEEIAEFVVNFRQGHREQRKKREARDNRGERHDREQQGFLFCKCGGRLFREGEPPVAKAWSEHRTGDKR